jgi:broad specificity phosphatase PhoE
MGMPDEHNSVERLREQAAQQGISPTDDDLEGVLDFVTRVLPALEEIERRLPPETAP